MNKSDLSSPSNTSPFEHPRNRTEHGLQVTVAADRYVHLGDANRYRHWVRERTKSVGVNTLEGVGVSNNHAGDERRYAKAQYDPPELTQSQRAALAASAEVNRHAKSYVETLGDMELHQYGIPTDDQPIRVTNSRVENFASQVEQGRIAGYPTQVVNTTNTASVIDGSSGDAEAPARRIPNNPDVARSAYAALEQIFGPSAETAATDKGTSVDDIGLDYEGMNEPSGGSERV